MFYIVSKTQRYRYCRFHYLIDTVKRVAVATDGCLRYTRLVSEWNKARIVYRFDVSYFFLIFYETKYITKETKFHRSFNSTQKKYSMINMSEKLSWKKASEICERDGKYLLSIRSVDESKFILQMLSIGGFLTQNESLTYIGDAEICGRRLCES